MRATKSMLWLVIILFSFSYIVVGTPVVDAAKPSMKVVVDGVEIKLAVKPIVVNGSTMLHAKGIFDALKINAAFDKKRITVKHADVTYKADVDQTRIYVGSRELRLTQAPVVRDGRIYVPARFVSIVIGKDATYDAKANQLIFGLTDAARKALQRSLFAAAIKGDAAAVTSLIKRGADPNGKLLEEYLDHTPLNYAVINNKTEAARALVAGGFVMNGNDIFLGITVITHQNAELLDILLSAGLDPNKRDRVGTLLETAAGVISIGSENGTSKMLNPSPAVVSTLLKHGADPGLDNSLYRAVSAQNYSIIQSLLRAGADPYKVNEHGTTPYELSVQNNTNRWLIIQDGRVELPSIIITDAKGKQINDGNMNLRSLDSPNELNTYVSWSNGPANVDAANGRYQINDLMIYGTTYIAPLNSYITIQGTTITPNTLKLPELNVRAKLTSNTIAIADGTIMIYDSNRATIAHASLSGSTVQLYAPAGKYRIISYRDSSGIPHTVDVTFTVSTGNDVQDLSLVLEKLSDFVPSQGK
ncbi:stalk domain-containing protein [Paenibacillus sinopodophylli]|uniref:stalk domain-containing protein n=1 Tax=Paenibacillus sinopodophylli TaxID=1837342 RepID=UPI00110CAB9F|nr:stalk domain-containing protein [Paenibacillus sinopodophylli]